MAPKRGGVHSTSVLGDRLGLRTVRDTHLRAGNLVGVLDFPSWNTCVFGQPARPRCEPERCTTQSISPDTGTVGTAVQRYWRCGSAFFRAVAAAFIFLNSRFI